MKNLIYSLAGLCILLFCNPSSVSAQFSGTYDNHQMFLMRPGGANVYLINVTKKGFYHAAGGSGPHKYQVEMKDGKKLKVNSYIWTDTVRKATYLIVPRDYGQPNAYRDPEKRIYCNETKSINNSIATDSCWLFNVIKGKINAYGPSPELNVNECLFAIQAGDGPIQPFTVQALEEMLKDDAEARKYLKKKKFANAIDTYNYNQKRKQEEEEYAEATKGY